MNGASRRASSRSTGSCTDLDELRELEARRAATGENAPMPPVFGPASPSNARLKSRAGGRPSAVTPSQIANTDSSSPSSSSSTTKSSPMPDTARSAASSSSCVRQTKTPFPAASPSALTTHGGRATASASGVGTPAACMTSFAKRFEPSIRAAAALGPNTATPPSRSASATPDDERHLGPDHDEVDRERAREREQALGVLRVHRVARPEPGDPRVAGRGVQLGEPRALRELPGERVLAPARPHDQNLHAPDANGGVGSRRDDAARATRRAVQPGRPERRLRADARAVHRGRRARLRGRAGRAVPRQGGDRGRVRVEPARRRGRRALERGWRTTGRSSRATPGARTTVVRPGG